MSDRYESFNDGLLQYGTKKTKLSPTKKSIGYTFTELGALYFNELSARDQDYDLAKTKGKELELKIKTFYPPQLTPRSQDKSDLIIIIDGIEYEIFKVDSDADKKYLFWYLSKVGPAQSKVGDTDDN